VVMTLRFLNVSRINTIRWHKYEIYEVLICTKKQTFIVTFGLALQYFSGRSM